MRSKDEIVLENETSYMHLAKIKDEAEGEKKITNLAAKLAVIRMENL